MGRWQFSIRLMLMVTAAVATVFAAASAEVTWKSCLALEFLAILFASIAVVAAWKCRGSLRVFWGGAAVPAAGAAATYFVYACLACASAMIEPAEALVMVASGVRVSLPVIWCLSLANGLLCALVYGLLSSAGSRAEAR